MEYLRTHPYIRFMSDLRRAPSDLRGHLARCVSLCEMLEAIEMDASVKEAWLGYARRSSALASARIEGSLMSYSDVVRIYNGEEISDSEIPLRYLAEPRNILDGYKRSFALLDMDSRWYQDLNGIVMRDITRKDGLSFGEIRSVSVAVGGRRCPNADECGRLLERFFSWLPYIGEELGDDVRLGVGGAIIRASMAHLYGAWIHPFVDGNGRSSRLMEWHIARDGGVPELAAHQLSLWHWEARNAPGGYYDRLMRSVILPPEGENRYLLYSVAGLRGRLEMLVKTLQELDPASALKEREGLYLMDWFPVSMRRWVV